MVEVFRTNVDNETHARMLVHQIETTLGYNATFDLDDCDRVLRVQCSDDCVRVALLVKLLKDFGFNAEILP